MGSIRLTPNIEALVSAPAPGVPVAAGNTVSSPAGTAGGTHPSSVVTAPVTSPPRVKGALSYEVNGNPTEACLLTLGIGLAPTYNKIKSIRTHHKRISEISFDSAYKYMATMHLVEAKFVRKLKLAGATSRALLRQGTTDESSPDSNEEDAVKPNSGKPLSVLI